MEEEALRQKEREQPGRAAVTVPRALMVLSGLLKRTQLPCGS